MAMIELIFAIVIIAISVLSIPSMMNVADQASKQAIIDEDVMSRLSGWTLDKFQARWDEQYAASGSGILWITGTELGCIRGDGNVYFRANPDSNIRCNENNATPSGIPTYPDVNADGNLSKGLERLNGGTEPITIKAPSGEEYSVSATYAVDYVPSTVSMSGNTATAAWVLGSSDAMEAGSVTGPTHLKRVVTRFRNDNLGVNTTLTFFKSNKGN